MLDYEPVAGKVTTASADALLSHVAAHGLHVERLIETHVHADHLTAAAYLKRRLAALGHTGPNGEPAPLVCIGERITAVQETFAEIFKIPESEMKRDGSQFDHLWAVGETFSLGSLACRVLFTPGHTPACATVLIGPDAAFVGDTLFLEDVGSARVDFPRGSAEALWESITNGLFALPDNVRIYVGHDYPPVEAGKPLRDPAFCATVASEKAGNKHINASTQFDAFKEWRETRDKSLGRPRLLYQSLQVNMRAGEFPKRRLEGKEGELPALVQPVELPSGF